MKKLISSLLVCALLISPTYAQEYKLTFEDARKMAVESSDKLKLQQEIINSFDEKYKKQKDDPSQNNPNYEYDGINKIPVYSNTYKTYDFKKLYDESIQTKKDMIVANEQKTMSLFTGFLNAQNDIKNKKTDIDEQAKLVKQATAQYKVGKITKLELDNAKLALENLNSSLETLNGKLDLSRQKLIYHLNLKDNDTFNLILVEPKLDLLLPEDLVKNNLKDKKQYKDLQSDLKELNKDMKWIETINYGANYKSSTTSQQKLIDEKEKDIKEFKRNTLNKYDQIYYKILIKANDISLDKIKKASLELKKVKAEQLYKRGVTNRNALNKLESDIQKNILSQNSKQLEIRALLLNYND